MIVKCPCCKHEFEVRKRRKKYVKKVPKKSGRPTVRPDFDTFKIMVNHYDIKTIAKMFGLPESTIRTWKHYYTQKGCDFNE